MNYDILFTEDETTFEFVCFTVCDLAE